MSGPAKSPHTTAESWSARITDRYGCILSPVLVDWFDGGIWNQPGRIEYREPIDPARLIADAPESIWPGLMSCDVLPIISNTAGDWLCVRVDRDGTAAEIIQWYHGAGDWIPWGNDLAQAIVFDALVDRLPGASRRHAVPAENPRPDAGKPDRANDPMLRWALQHVPSSLTELFNGPAGEQQVALALLEAHVAEVAVRCELVQSDLMQSTQSFLEPLFDTDPKVSRDLLSEWIFDVRRIPPQTLRLLEQQHGAALDAMQDWDAAESHAQRVTQLAPDLAWAWDICGYAAERRGDIERAKDSYRRAASCSVFTDQSIRLETHWMADQSAKFSAARLLHLSPDEVAASTYLSLLCSKEVDQRRSAATAYWIEQGSQFEASGNDLEAYQCLMAAAWDVGAEPIGIYAGLLERIAESAERTNQASRAEIARTHRRCLQDRYNV